MEKEQKLSMKEKIKQLFNEYYNDETMPVIELEDNVLALFDVSGSLPDANPHICPECSWQCTCSDQPCSCCSGNEA